MEKKGRGGKGVSRNTMGEIKEGRRYTVYNFVPSEALVHLNFVPFVGVGIMRAHDDTHSGQHALQTHSIHYSGLRGARVIVCGTQRACELWYRCI